MTIVYVGIDLAKNVFAVHGVDDAHAAGLKVVPYTFRNENQFLPPSLRSSADPNAYGDAFSEYKAFFDLGVDGVFSDNPDTAVAARTEWEASS